MTRVCLSLIRTITFSFSLYRPFSKFNYIILVVCVSFQIKKKFNTTQLQLHIKEGKKFQEKQKLTWQKLCFLYFFCVCLIFTFFFYFVRLFLRQHLLKHVLIQSRVTGMCMRLYELVYICFMIYLQQLLLVMLLQSILTTKKKYTDSKSSTNLRLVK